LLDTEKVILGSNCYSCSSLST